MGSRMRGLGFGLGKSPREMRGRAHAGGREGQALAMTRTAKETALG